MEELRNIENYEQFKQALDTELANQAARRLSSSMQKTIRRYLKNCLSGKKLEIQKNLRASWHHQELQCWLPGHRESERYSHPSKEKDSRWIYWQSETMKSRP